MKISNVKIVNHNSTIENADIIIKNNMIMKIIKKQGKGITTVIPGFIETHIHGFGGEDSMDSTEAVEHMSRELGKSGVTTFLPTLMTGEWKKVVESIANAAKAKTINAKIAGLHLEGPFISVAKKGAHKPELIIKATKEKLLELHIASKAKLVRIVIAPEVNTSEVIKYSVKLGMVVCIGHTNATATQTYQAIDDGATAITHLWNGMSGVVNRNPGVAEGALVDDRVYTELICDLVHVCKETIKLTIKTKGPEKVIVISDSIRPAGLADGEYTSGGIPVIKKGTKITLKKSGTIAGGAGSIDVGYRTLLSLGYPMEDIVKMTSYNAALNHKWEMIAQIKEGYYADFIILDEKNQIKDTYINGKLVIE